MNWTSPAVIRAFRGSRRMSASASVVFPEPLSPMTATVSPRSTSKETSRVARSGPRRVGCVVDYAKLPLAVAWGRGHTVRSRGLKMSSRADTSETSDSWNSTIARMGERMYQSESRK